MRKFYIFLITISCIGLLCMTNVIEFIINAYGLAVGIKGIYHEEVV